MGCVRNICETGLPAEQCTGNPLIQNNSCENVQNDEVSHIFISSFKPAIRIKYKLHN